MQYTKSCKTQNKLEYQQIIMKASEPEWTNQEVSYKRYAKCQDC